LWFSADFESSSL